MQQQSKISESKLRAQERARSQKWAEGWGWDRGEEGRGLWWQWEWGWTTGPGCWCAWCALSAWDSWLIIWFYSFPTTLLLKVEECCIGKHGQQSVPWFPFLAFNIFSTRKSLSLKERNLLVRPMSFIFDPESCNAFLISFLGYVFGGKDVG